MKLKNLSNIFNKTAVMNGLIYGGLGGAYVGLFACLASIPTLNYHPTTSVVAIAGILGFSIGSILGIKFFSTPEISKNKYAGGV